MTLIIINLNETFFKNHLYKEERYRRKGVGQLSSRDSLKDQENSLMKINANLWKG